MIESEDPDWLSSWDYQPKSSDDVTSSTADTTARGLQPPATAPNPDAPTTATAADHPPTQHEHGHHHHIPPAPLFPAALAAAATRVVGSSEHAQWDAPSLAATDAPAASASLDALPRPSVSVPGDPTGAGAAFPPFSSVSSRPAPTSNASANANAHAPSSARNDEPNFTLRRTPSLGSLVRRARGASLSHHEHERGAPTSLEVANTTADDDDDDLPPPDRFQIPGTILCFRAPVELGASAAIKVGNARSCMVWEKIL